jgi:nicotinamide-nucleotide amidase
MNLQRLSDYFDQNEIRLATAESCTAGLIAATLGDLPGCGSWFECGFVTYSPQAKYRALGVQPETVERCNLTSEQVAREMVEGALRNSRANVAVSNTGLAGPSNGDSAIPVGTVCFGWGFEHNGVSVVYSETRRFDGDRNEVRKQAAEYAIERIPHYYEQLPGGVLQRFG